MDILIILGFLFICMGFYFFGSYLLHKHEPEIAKAQIGLGIAYILIYVISILLLPHHPSMGGVIGSMITAGIFMTVMIFTASIFLNFRKIQSWAWIQFTSIVFTVPFLVLVWYNTNSIIKSPLFSP